jgi:glycosidase
MPRNPLIVTLLLALLLCLGCSGDDDPNVPDDPSGPTDAEVLAAGWQAYEDGDLAAAEDEFRELLARARRLAEAHDGLGWTFAAQNAADSSLVHFTAAVAARADTMAIADQTHAGLAFALAASLQWEDCLVAAALVASDWTFAHDDRFDHDQVVLLAALAHYALGDFAASLAAVQELDPEFTVDVETPGGRADLAARIEELQIHPDGPPTVPDPPEVEATAWWNDQVFYEVFVRSFYDSDGDGIGDLQGLISQLDYLNDGDPETTSDLGVTALWLMPIVQSPSDHGYDATDYYTVESDYGTNADFEELMTEAHARGMRVIVDYVMNHCSSQHPWFLASAANDPDYAFWFSWRVGDPGWTQPWGSGPVWHWSSTRSLHYYGIFWSEMPDLNYTNPAVEAEMFDIATYWLDDMGADGFRLDAVKYLMEDGNVIDNAPSTFSFWSRFRQHLDTVAPDAFTVGEAWDATSIVREYIDAGLHTCFEFDLASAMIGAASGGQAGGVASKVDEMVDAYPYLQYATFLTNHDQQRVHSQLGEDTGRNKVAAAMLLTLPGVPFLFYGEEVGMISSWSHPDVRRPMHWTGASDGGFTSGDPWTDPASNVATNNVQTMQADPGSLWNHYRRLVQIRAASPALRRGTFQRIATGSDQVLAFLRWHDDQAIAVVHNLRASNASDWSLALASSKLAPGQHAALEQLTGQPVATLTADEHGGFADWSPVSTLAGHATQVIELTFEPTVRPAP